MTALAEEQWNDRTPEEQSFAWMDYLMSTHKKVTIEFKDGRVSVAFEELFRENCLKKWARGSCSKKGLNMHERFNEAVLRATHYFDETQGAER